MYDEFTKRDTVVIAVAQEDKDLESHGQIIRSLNSPDFDVVCDVGRRKTERYHRTAAYLIDKEGIVRDVFPMLIRSRPSWKAILHEVDKLSGG